MLIALAAVSVLQYVDYSLFTLSEWLICMSSYSLFAKMVIQVNQRVHK